jgi:hypothetical protein
MNGTRHTAMPGAMHIAYFQHHIKVSLKRVLTKFIRNGYGAWACALL